MEEVTGDVSISAGDPTPAALGPPVQVPRRPCFMHIGKHLTCGYKSGPQAGLPAPELNIYLPNLI